MQRVHCCFEYASAPPLTIPPKHPKVVRCDRGPANAGQALVINVCQSCYFAYHNFWGEAGSDMHWLRTASWHGRARFFYIMNWSRISLMNTIYRFRGSSMCVELLGVVLAPWPPPWFNKEASNTRWGGLAISSIILFDNFHLFFASKQACKGSLCRIGLNFTWVPCSP